MSITSKIKDAIKKIDRPTNSSSKVTYTTTSIPTTFTVTTCGHYNYPTTAHAIIPTRPVASKVSTYEYNSSSSTNGGGIGGMWSVGGVAQMPLTPLTPSIHTTTMLGGSGVYSIPGRTVYGGSGHTIVNGPVYSTTPVTTITTTTTTTTSNSPISYSPLVQSPFSSSSGSSPQIREGCLSTVSSTTPSYLPSDSNINSAPYHGVPKGLLEEQREFQVFTYQPKTLKPKKNTIPTKSEWETEKQKIEQEVADHMQQFDCQESHTEDSVIISMAVSEATFQKNSPNPEPTHPHPPSNDGTQYVPVLGAHDSINLTQIQQSESSSDGGY